jgi:hypothetical protein
MTSSNRWTGEWPAHQSPADETLELSSADQMPELDQTFGDSGTDEDSGIEKDSSSEEYPMTI